MSKRIDWFYADGTHEHVVVTPVTAEVMFKNWAKHLRSGKAKAVADYLGNVPMTSVIMGDTQEEPYF